MWLLHTLTSGHQETIFSVSGLGQLVSHWMFISITGTTCEKLKCWAPSLHSLTQEV